MTHPFNNDKPAAIERRLSVPNELGAKLTFRVAAHEQGGWELRALINGKPVHKQIVDREGKRWKTVEIDLAAFAGKQVELRLENHANDWAYEFGYWSDIQLRTAKQARAD